MEDYSEFDEARFLDRFSKGLQKAKTLLGVARNPTLPGEVPHTYDDKFLLAQFSTKIALDFGHTLFRSIGLPAESCFKAHSWVRDQKRAVTLIFTAEERCTFLRKTVREVEDSTQVVGEILNFLRKETVVRKVTEWFWKFDVSWSVRIVLEGAEQADSLPFLSRSTSVELKTLSEATPRPLVIIRPPLSLDLTWFLSNFSTSPSSPSPLSATYHIDRLDPRCRTPRRNPSSESALNFFKLLRTFSLSLTQYLIETLYGTLPGKAGDLKALGHMDHFCPVLPLLESAQGGPPLDGPLFLEEAERVFLEKQAELRLQFGSDGLLSGAEAALILFCQHVYILAEAHSDALGYLEHLLLKQLISALGRKVGPEYFADFVRFHSRKLFQPEVAPKQFAYAVRRLGHAPEGLVTLEEKTASGLPSPVLTFASPQLNSAPMRFPLDAATEVQFKGERILHGWVRHEFDGSSGTTLQLTARARQFSSYIVLLGRVVSAEVFEPKFASIVSNGDELTIPINVETIPTAKEFREAISSLSPTQQRFASAYRSLQLEGTVLGVLILQIKPQLERLLNLPVESLTKELELTEQLQLLLIEHQVPADLLSYSGPESAGQDEKLGLVREAVAKISALFEVERMAILREAAQHKLLRNAEETTRKAQIHDVDQTKAIMLNSIDKILDRGDRLESLVDKSNSLEADAFHFKAKATKLKKSTWGANLVSKVASAAVSLVRSDESNTRAEPVVQTRSQPPQPPSPSSSQGEATSSGQSTGEQSSSPDAKPNSTSASNGDPSALLLPQSQEERLDYTQFPRLLESALDRLDSAAAVRPTLLHPATTWGRRRQTDLLSQPRAEDLNSDALGKERQRAWDLLDALTKSGLLPLEEATLHVVLAVTHCFDKSVMATLVEDNVNPISKVERSLVTVASVVHRKAPLGLLTEEHVERLAEHFPPLLTE